MSERGYHFDASEVCFDDIHQTGQLLALQGKTPNHKIIKRKLEAEGLTTYDFLEELPISAEPINWADHNPDPEVVFQLAQWAINQSAVIRDRIFSFLEGPSQLEANEIIEFLVSGGAIQKPPVTEKARPRPLTSILLEELKRRRSLAIDEIYQFEYLLTSKRPRAALRQALRRLINWNQAVEHNGRFYATGY